MALMGMASDQGTVGEFVITIDVHSAAYCSYIGHTLILFIVGIIIELCGTRPGQLSVSFSTTGEVTAHCGYQARTAAQFSTTIRGITSIIMNKIIVNGIIL